jgi:hypothetical protein
MRTGTLLSGCLIFVGLLASVQADYYIDDANSTVKYSSTIGLSLFAPLNLTDGYYLIDANGSEVQLDYGRFYDETV